MDPTFLLVLLIVMAASTCLCPLGALVVLPEGQQRSGSIGGTVWSHNSAGAYIRNRSVPVNPNTDRQVAVRNFVRGLAIAWNNTLTQIQRDAWNTYAANVTWINALGQSIHLTGLNHYIRSNTPRLLCALARLDAAPTIFNLATAEQALGASAQELTQLLTVSFDDTAAWTTETGGFELFSMGIPQNGSIKFFGGPWRVITCLFGQDAPNGEPASPTIMPTRWPIAEGQRLWIRSRIGRADGRLSEFARVNFLCDA